MDFWKTPLGAIIVHAPIYMLVLYAHNFGWDGGTYSDRAVQAMVYAYPFLVFVAILAKRDR
jgi:hypothetical protein